MAKEFKVGEMVRVSDYEGIFCIWAIYPDYRNPDNQFYLVRRANAEGDSSMQIDGSHLIEIDLGKVATMAEQSEAQKALDDLSQRMAEQVVEAGFISHDIQRLVKKLKECSAKILALQKFVDG